MAAHNVLVNLLSCHTNRKTGQKQSSEVFCKERCYCKFCKIHKKHLWQNLFFNKVAGLKPATVLKKSPWHRCFPMNSGKFLRTSFLQNISVRPLLKGQCKFLVDISLFRVSYGNIRAMCEIWLKLNDFSDVLMSILLTLNKSHTFLLTMLTLFTFNVEKVNIGWDRH